jgi:hypothetical protein
MTLVREQSQVMAYHQKGFSTPISSVTETHGAASRDHPKISRHCGCDHDYDCRDDERHDDECVATNHRQRTTGQFFRELTGTGRIL